MNHLDKRKNEYKIKEREFNGCWRMRTIWSSKDHIYGPHFEDVFSGQFMRKKKMFFEHRKS